MKLDASSRPAVLVIDVQNGLFKSSPPPFEADLVIDRINGVLDLARLAEVPIFFMQHDGKASENVQPFTEGWQLHGRLKALPEDTRIRKTTCDCFYQTPLEDNLRSRGVSALVVMGYATEFCIDATVRNAASKDFELIVVSDAHTTNDSPILKARQVRDHFNWAWPNCASSKHIAALPAAEVNFAHLGSLRTPPL